MAAPRTALIATAFVCLCVGLSRAVFAAAPEWLGREVREFEILVQGKPSGTNTLTIDEFTEECVVVETSASVRVNYLVYVYNFQFRGKEMWFNQRLRRFDGVTVDDGKKSTINGLVETADSRLVIDGRESAGSPAFTMTTNYWRLPSEESLAAGTMAIVDAATGKTLRVRLERGGATHFVGGGQTIPCTEYRLTGDVDVTFWFDAGGRLVRQTCVEDGYPTELRLSKISRNHAAAVSR